MEDWVKELNDKWGHTEPVVQHPVPEQSPKPQSPAQPKPGVPIETLKELIIERLNEQKVSTNSKSSNRFLVPVFLVVLVVFAAVVGFVVWKKGQTQVVNSPPAIISNPINSNSQNAELIQLKNEIKELRAIVELNKKKVQVLGITSNENAAIAKYGYNKNDIIIISRLWGIPLPNYLHLTDEDREFINQLPVYEKEPIKSSLSQPEPALTSFQPQESGSLSNHINELQAKMVQLEEKQKINSSKLIVVGLVINENAAAMRAKDNQAISISQSWGLDARPKYLLLNPEQLKVVNSLLD